MNGHQKKISRTTLRRLSFMVSGCLYLTVLPAGIVNYGIQHGISTFDNGAPFHEVYSVFFLAWSFANALVFLIAFSFYNIFRNLAPSK